MRLTDNKLGVSFGARHTTQGKYMAEVKTPSLKWFSKEVAHYVKIVEDEAKFYTDEEWIALILSKIVQFSDPINTGDLVLLGALIEVWGTDRGRDSDL